MTTRFLRPDALAPASGYTPAVEVTGGRTLHISGQVPLDAQGHLVGPGDFEAQARQVFTNIGHALAAAGMDFNHVVKLGLYVLDMANRDTLRRVRDEFVNTAQPPASTLVEVSALFRPDVLVEVEAVAVGGSVSLPVSFDHCVVHVSDWARSNDFYARVLGTEVIPRGAGFMYRFGDVQLNLHGPGLDPTPVARLPVQPGGSDLCFEWAGPIEAAAAHLSAQGVPIELGPVPRFGARGERVSVYFRDPDGSLLEFISYDRRA